MNKLIFKTLAVAALLVSAVSAAPIQVGTRLSLVIDVSGSVTTAEYNLQMDGYGAAFRNAANQALIVNGGGIAVNYVFFASSATTASTWTLLSDVASINAYATVLENVARPFSSSTGIAGGIRSSLASFADTTYTANRNVIDVSGDGEENVSTDAAVRGQRDAAAAAGIVINGVTIGTGGGNLFGYYTNNVITSGGFVEAAVSFTDFSDAINKKLFRELGGDIPEPSTYAMMATGLLGLAYFRRKK
ncbi:MAG: DUF1194 domain-containing protein [Acidobacteria bacterium]|nr:DUF1194 domain-containing protein [Acidobacteriota bacterium]